MNEDVDKNIAQRVEKALTEDLSSLEKSTQRKLQGARYQALESYGREKRTGSALGNQGLIPGVIFACSLCVVAGIWLIQRPSVIFNEATYDGQAVMYQIDSNEISPGELELVEELEFYEWLDFNGYAG